LYKELTADIAQVCSRAEAVNKIEYKFGDNGPATGAFLHYPEGVTTDAAGNVVIVDSDNQRIRALRGRFPRTALI